MSKKSQFLNLGVQYFILARSSVFFGLQTISGVMYHHAFELLIKTSLESKYTPKELKDKFGHKLEKLWKEFKKQHPNEDLSKFDELITDIARWEGIRYMDFPENMWAIAFTVDFSREDKEQIKKNMIWLRKKGQELYSFMFDEADELFSKILSLIPVSPEYAAGLLFQKEAHKIYLRENKSPYWKKAPKRKIIDSE